MRDTVMILVTFIATIFLFLGAITGCTSTDGVEDPVGRDRGYRHGHGYELRY
ncbi:MAG: hypothetical protein JXR91_00995 [Deltaproteobacteria bacterium]|nr:hypothetical protein [Deltaproteobacteria bacterium]